MRGRERPGTSACACTKIKVNCPQRQSVASYRALLFYRRSTTDKQIRRSGCDAIATESDTNDF